MKKIAYLTWGAASQITSFQDFARYLDEMIYLRELETHDLARYAAVVVPDGTDSVAIREAMPGASQYRRLIDGPFCWLGYFAEDDGHLRRRQFRLQTMAGPVPIESGTDRSCVS